MGGVNLTKVLCNRYKFVFFFILVDIYLKVIKKKVKKKREKKRSFSIRRKVVSERRNLSTNPEDHLFIYLLIIWIFYLLFWVDGLSIFFELFRDRFSLARGPLKKLSKKPPTGSNVRMYLV